jgi:drug/metabolite transporter (DMT)-like permease
MTILLGLTAAAAWAFVNLWLVPLSRRLPPLLTMLALLGASTLLTLPLALIFEGLPGPDARARLPVVALAGLLEVGAFACYLVAVREGSLAVIAPLLGLSGGVAAVIAILAGEHITHLIAGGLVLAVCGTALACARRGERRVQGIGWAIASGVLFGVMFTMYGASEPLDSFSAVTAARVAAVLLLGPIVLARTHVPITRNELVQLVGIGALDAIGFCAFVAAASRGPVSVASVCAAQFSTLTVALGIILLRERPARVQLLGIAMTLVGTSLLATAG